jgi:TIGR00255 family protein
MIKSMTGFGRKDLEFPGKKITIEIKSLNSKQLDLNLKLPGYYREKEFELRSMLAREIVRGKVDFSIYIDFANDERDNLINKDLFSAYLKQMKNLAKEHNIKLKYEPVIQTILRLPDILKVERQELAAEEWNIVSQGVADAIKQFNEFRIQEGMALQKDFERQISTISKRLDAVEPYEKERIETVKARLTEAFADLSNQPDPDRFQQEVIFYLEKLDVNEEKVRLRNHLKYFMSTINEEENVGRKLGFISQEMGREINTLGSKANHAAIQKLVVEMKDELEKIKEQVLNVL